MVGLEIRNCTEEKSERKKQKRGSYAGVISSFSHIPPNPFPIMFSYYATLLIFPVEMGSSSNKCIRQVSHEWP